ncbi:MAG: AAA family ATPase [Bacteroidales bacterium]|nr:AAA family ATPase [Bacteroidales bacterium]
MIKKFEFTNYKAFDNGSIELKPITILLGANSSGKSSLLQLLLMFVQTTNYEAGYESALKLNGKFVGLGEVENIFKNRNTKKDLNFSFEIDSKRFFIQVSELRRMKRNIESEIVDLYYQFKKIENISSASAKKDQVRSRIFRTNEEIAEDDLTKLLKEIKRIKRKVSKKQFEQPTLFDEAVSNRLLRKNIEFKDREFQKLLETDINEYFDAYKLLSAINKHNLRNFTIEFNVSYSKKLNKLVVNRITIKKDKSIIIEFYIQKNKGHLKFLLTSDIVEKNVLEKYRVRFGRNVTFETLNLVPKTESIIDANRFRRTTIENEMFCTTVLKIFNLFSILFNRAFDSSRINYISPLRAFPKRYYFLDESNVASSLDSIDGDNLTETLKKESNVMSKVNKWLDNFGLSVSVEDVKEVIHRLKISQNGLNLDITDVGFGISQVLPIIVQGFLSKEESLTIVEQPEIHLHPMMQAELADLFIDVVCTENNAGKILLIETHSESILKRLRRRIAEGKIKNSDIAIYFIHSRQKKNSSAIIEKIEIGEKGAFDWPKEFYTTDFEDTNEFLKHQ